MDTPDFSNEKVSVDILKQDKHTRLEGLCIEEFFKEKYLGTVDEFKQSSSWWFSKENANSKDYYAIKFLSELNLSEFDIFISSHFLKKGIPVYVIFHDSDGHYYTYHVTTKEELNIKNLTNNSVLYKYTDLKPLTSFIRDESRQNQAIDFLRKRDLIQKCAIERFFANRVAGFKGLWDVDTFEWINRNQIKAYEVKQKFPAANGCFGINKGTTSFLLFLKKLDIAVEHVILKKPKDDKNIPALDFITKSEYIGKNEWLSTDFCSDSVQNMITKKSPNYTSIHGKYRLSYYDMDMKLFKSKGFV